MSSIRNTILETLKTRLLTIKQSAGYNLDIRDVTRYPIGLSDSRLNTPLIEIVPGEGTRLVESDTYIRYAYTPSLFFFIKSGDDMSVTAEYAVADAKKLINAGINLGTNVLSCTIEADAPYVIQEYPGYAAVDIRLKIIYYESKDNTATVLTDVYGTSDWLYTAHQYLYAKLQTMITDIAALNPRISYAYDKHNVAELKTNAVTVGLDTAGDELGGLESGVFVRHTANYSVRVHTGYAGEQLDDKESMMLINTVSAYLHRYHKLAANYRIREFSGYSARESFEESATIGGQFIVRVEIPELHTQG